MFLENKGEVNKTRFNKKLLLIVSLILVVLAGVVTVMLSPSFRPVESIRKDILKLLPLGTSLEDAVKVFEKKGNWKLGYKPNRHSWSPEDSQRVLNDSTAKKYIFILGDFMFQITDLVLMFDGEGLYKKLIEVEVRRYIAP